MKWVNKIGKDEETRLFLWSERKFDLEVNLCYIIYSKKNIYF